MREEEYDYLSTRPHARDWSSDAEVTDNSGAGFINVRLPSISFLQYLRLEDREVAASSEVSSPCQHSRPF